MRRPRTTMRNWLQASTPDQARELAKAADTSVAREYHAGMATMSGIQAVRAAQRGYKAEERILEMKLGFFETLGGVPGAQAAARATSDLGASWDIVTDMAVKLVPGGHPSHALAEAAANAAREGNIAAAEIDSITVSRPGMTALTGPLHPKDLVDMAHSPAYFVDAGVADRERQPLRLRVLRHLAIERLVAALVRLLVEEDALHRQVERLPAIDVGLDRVDAARAVAGRHVADQIGRAHV